MWEEEVVDLWSVAALFSLSERHWKQSEIFAVVGSNLGLTGIVDVIKAPWVGFVE